MKDLLLFLIIYPFLKVVEFLPLSISNELCRFSLKLLLPFVKDRLKIAQKNLSIAFPQKSREEIEKIAKESFLNLSEVLAFTIKMPRFNSLEKIEKYVKIENFEEVERIKKEKRGLILVSAHFSLWEIMPLICSLRGEKIYFFYRKLDNRFFNNYILRRRSVVDRMIPLEKRGNIKPVLKALKNEDIVGILMDQNVLRKDGVFVNFFGLKASTSPIAPFLAKKTGAAVIPVFIIPTGKKFKYRMKFFPEIKIERGNTLEEYLTKNTQKIMDVFEEVIREYPEYWMWIHKRWKTRPEGEEEIY